MYQSGDGVGGVGHSWPPSPHMHPLHSLCVVAAASLIGCQGCGCLDVIAAVVRAGLPWVGGARRQCPCMISHLCEGKRKAAQQNGRQVDQRGEAGSGRGQQVHNAPRAKNFCRAPPEGSARRNCRRQKEAGGRSKRAGGKQQETKQSKHQM